MVYLSSNSIIVEVKLLQYGEIIKELRKSKGITQEELGNMVGRKQNQISEWENGKIQPNPDDIFNICKALNVSVSRFYGVDDEYEPVIEVAKDKQLTPEQIIKAMELYSDILKQMGDKK
jgi:transcriptional regulator with XRE-family HTH domain